MSLPQTQRNEWWYKGLILLALVLVCIGLTVVVNLIWHTPTVYTQFFYVAILLAAIWYPRRAWALAVFLGALHVGASFVDTGFFDLSTTRASSLLSISHDEGRRYRSRL
jgi:hypothetical protein